MRSAPALLHAHVAPPPSDGCAELPRGALCWMCGGAAGRGTERAGWAGASFTGQNKVRVPSSPWVCEPCVWVCSRVSPVPGRPAKPGKTLGGNFRNYSHLYERTAGGGVEYVNASKGEKPAILAFLRRRHAGEWFAAIADSGQKHVLPWTPINPAGARRGRVLFEEALVRLPGDDGGWSLVDEIAALLTAGASKEEVARGDYGAGAWGRCEAAIRSFERAWSWQRGSAWFDLALWLGQRDEVAVAERRQQAPRRVPRKGAADGTA